MEFKHKPVLLEECINGLKIKPDGIYVDGTLGGAGHSSEIVKKLNKNRIFRLIYNSDKTKKLYLLQRKNFQSIITLNMCMEIMMILKIFYQN